MPNKINNTPSIDAVAQQLNQWRNNRAHRNIPIPIEFKRRAIALLQNHSKKQVTLALGINHKMLTQWQKSLQEISTEPPGFIELSLDHEEPLDTPADSGPLNLTVRYDGNQLQINGAFSVADVTALIQNLNFEGARS